MSHTATTVGPHLAAIEQRRAILASAIKQEVRKGWRVESQTDYQVTLARGHRPNHVLHLLLSIVTLGVWVPVWILVSVLSGEKRRVVTVDEFGKKR